MGSAEKSHWTGRGEASSMSWAGGSGMKTGQMSGDEGQGQVQVAMGPLGEFQSRRSGKS